MLAIIPFAFGLFFVWIGTNSHREVGRIKFEYHLNPPAGIEEVQRRTQEINSKRHEAKIYRILSTVLIAGGLSWLIIARIVRFL